MQLSEIRKMNDNELKAFLMRMQNGNNFCTKCGEYVDTQGKKNVYINTNNIRGIRQRKLCHLCNNCYVDMLDYLGVSDIDWE